MQALQEEIGRRIRELREKRGISQESLASICNLHRTYVGLIERGERNLSLATIAAIAQALEVPVADLFVTSNQSARPDAASARLKPTGADITAHIEAIRQILIDANLTDAKRYDTVLRSKSKGGGEAR